MTRDELEHHFASRARRVGGLLLLAPDTALEFVQRAREARIRVLGIEGFRAAGGRIEPLLDEIADWSTHSDGWQPSIDFLTDRRSIETLFEITLDG